MYQSRRKLSPVRFCLKSFLRNPAIASQSVHGPSLPLANTMSLAPKIDEVRSTILELRLHLGFFTETWLRECIPADHILISGYHFVSRNRTTDHHNGVGLYIENSIKFKRLDYLQDPTLEVLWVWLSPTRLPRGISCLIAGTVYHPHFNDNVSDSILLDYLCESLTTIEGEYPGCGLFLCSDFNRLNFRRLTSQFRMKQLVNKPNGGEHTLDLQMTNLR